MRSHNFLLTAAVASVVGAMNIGAQVTIASPPSTPTNQVASSNNEPVKGDWISFMDDSGNRIANYELGDRKPIRKVDSINLIKVRADGKGLTKDTKYIAYTELLVKIVNRTAILAERAELAPV